MREQDAGGFGLAEDAELALDKVERVAVSTDLRVEVDDARFPQRDAGDQFDTGNGTIGKPAAVQRGRGLRVAAVGHEIEVAVAIHRRDALQIRRIHPLNLSAVFEVQVVDAFRPMQVGVYLWFIQVIKEQVFPVAAKERLHGVAVVALDGYPLRVLKRVGGGNGNLRDGRMSGAGGQNENKYRKESGEGSENAATPAPR